MTKSVQKKQEAPGKTVKDCEDNLISLANALAEKQLREGTASSQVVAHFLKLGSTREALEKERLRKETALLEAKADALESSQKIEALYRDAITAMRSYSGQTESESEYD